jgi:hypothetical protein
VKCVIQIAREAGEDILSQSFVEDTRKRLKSYKEGSLVDRIVLSSRAVSDQKWRKFVYTLASRKWAEFEEVFAAHFQEMQDSSEPRQPSERNGDDGASTASTDPRYFAYMID